MLPHLTQSCSIPFQPNLSYWAHRYGGNDPDLLPLSTKLPAVQTDGFRGFTPLSADEFRDSTLKQATAASSQILTFSTFIVVLSQHLTLYVTSAADTSSNSTLPYETDDKRTNSIPSDILTTTLCSVLLCTEAFSSGNRWEDQCSTKICMLTSADSTPQIMSINKQHQDVSVCTNIIKNRT
jgi:hypothetical protein